MDLTHAHWRDSARTPRFFMLDALSILPAFMWILHAKMWTFWFAIFTIIFFAILERFKFTVPVFLRWLRAFIAGPIRVANPNWRM